MKERFRITPAVYIILIKEGKVLMIRRKNTGHMDGMYSLPAGHLDGGEPASVACIREAKEEVGLDIKPEDLRLVHLIHRNITSYDGERMDIFFTTDKWKGNPTNCEPDKCDHVEWFSLDKLPQNTVPYVQQGLENFQKNIVYSEYWDYNISS